ncbi:hypothetical protein PRIPAC_97402 [Pristionchus pacificus]|uniref:Uncharacterized protein n=1 Tax=Pristionchus pacificus TaxID=54126 RepID=A0A2A6D2N3_PRIPA|nr:hypothetical protein PRIPAC_97402 [Pristionchus pacificus]|eukprot:PDM84596.1 hypothetical protein PRIPAC_33619 [Pristionchus pacificus]
MTNTSKRRSVNLPEDIDISDVDNSLLEEWDQLMERERTLELQVEKITESVHLKYPDLDLSHIVVSDVLKIDENTFLRRRSYQLKMRRSDFLMVDTADLQLLSEHWKVEMELDEIKKLRIENECKIREQSIEHGSTKEMEIKRGRWTCI